MKLRERERNKLDRNKQNKREKGKKEITEGRKEKTERKHGGRYFEGARERGKGLR